MTEPRFERIPTHNVRVPTAPSRVTMDPDRLRALADDIAAHGLLQPIGVAGPDADGFYELGFGHRRTNAHVLLGRATIDAKVWPLGTPLLAIRASENHMREQLTAIEEALEIHRFVEAGESYGAIAHKYRRSPAWAQARHALLDLPQELQDAIHTDAVSVSVAQLLAEIDHEPYRKQLVAEAVTNGASANTVRVWCAHYAADRERIQANHDTVEQIVAQRQQFIIKYLCEACGAEAPIHETSAFRVCNRCAQEIVKQIRAT